MILAVMVVALPILIVNDAGTGQPWFCEWICPCGTLLGGIPLTLLNAEFREIIGFRFFWKVGLLVVFCLGSIWYFRPFCKYLFHDFSLRLTLEQLQNVGPGSLVYGSMKVLACCIVFPTGIYVLCNSNDAEKVKSADQKVNFALLSFVLGFVVYVITTILQINQLVLASSYLIYAPYCLTCLPILKLLTLSMRRHLTNGKSKGLMRFSLVMFTILSVVNVVWGVLNVAAILF